MQSAREDQMNVALVDSKCVGQPMQSVVFLFLALPASLFYDDFAVTSTERFDVGNSKTIRNLNYFQRAKIATTQNDASIPYEEEIE